jgi:hypothetical protein
MADARFRMPGPGFPPAPPANVLPTPNDDPGPSYNTTQEKVAFVSRKEFPLTSIKRRWQGFDVAIQIDKFSGNEASIFCYAIQHGIRTLVASGRYTGGGQPQKVLSVRDVVADAFDITAISNHPPIFPAAVLVSVVASDQTTSVHEDAETFGVAGVVDDVGGTGRFPAIIDLSVPVLVGSDPSVSPFQGSCVLETGILAALPAASAAGVWLQAFDAANPIPVGGEAPIWSLQIGPSEAGVDFAEITRGLRYPSGAYLAASTTIDTYTPVAAGQAFGSFFIR